MLRRRILRKDRLAVLACLKKRLDALTPIQKTRDEIDINFPSVLSKSVVLNCHGSSMNRLPLKEVELIAENSQAIPNPVKTASVQAAATIK